MKKLLTALPLFAVLSLAQKPVLTTNGGVPVGDNQNSKTAGADGPVVLEDIHLIEKLANFDRERIPERVVHARGTGAHGEFVSAGDFSSQTKAAFLSAPGKKTNVFVRFSTVIHSQGSPEVARDPRGFATKFYTEEGNYDLVGNNLPVFFIRDALKFPDMVHSLKPSPVDNKQSPKRFFDFFSHQPEATHMLTFVYSDMGTPASYREMDGFGVHAFKWVNAAGDVTYVKYTWKSKQGHRNLTAKETEAVVGKDWAHLTTDLYENVRKGNYPQWDLYVQTLKPERLNDFSFNPLDATKLWPEAIAPLTKLGTMTLNRMPENFFEQTEQSAFSPGNLVPGIEPSEDRLLQGRLFSYFDTQRYRIGSNFQQLPINRPAVKVVTNIQNGAFSNQGRTGEVNYEPSRQNRNDANKSEYLDDNKYRYSRKPLSGTTLQQAIAKTDNFAQAGELYRSFSESERANLISNLAGDLSQVTDKVVLSRMVNYFYQADKDYGTRLMKALGLNLSEVQKAAAE
ncbi:catalase [Bryobacter aggregatus]|uniref:catalase n=1 Tax=Bryobacter aggregatus TaxID=360054 RepID=UPI0005653380|nr:catalase [Bryobacter aggregatus]